jgi:hypothetical protein
MNPEILTHWEIIPRRPDSLAGTWIRTMINGVRVRDSGVELSPTGTDRRGGLSRLLGILGGVESFQLLGLFLGPAIMAALMLLWRQLTTFPADQRDALVISQTGL